MTDDRAPVLERFERKIGGWCQVLDDYQHYQDCHGWPRVPSCIRRAMQVLAKVGYWCTGWRKDVD